MTLWDYRYKNQVTKVWYAIKYMSGIEGSGRAYAFATRHERDWFVHRTNYSKDFCAWATTRKEALSVSGFTNPKTDVILIDDTNKIVCISL